ncbi:3-dehydroquinate synthase [Spirosomataceae bacterium TFI 002]|nr:3-dehydroquinate synthase [Spirosomataceae bacterium TFI 002]
MSVVIQPISQSLSAYLAQNTYSKIGVVVDENTKKHCYPIVKSLLPKHTLISVKSGENNKNLDTCQLIWGKMTDAEFDRHSLIIDLGGGVIGDMGGFCAATYKRGIDFIQIPTTLLSQVDASVGGKLGIDFNGFKNHIGVFTQPKTVLIDTAFLKTLPSNELRSGFAEVIKHCLIRDSEMWDIIRRNDLTEQNIDELVAHSVAIKKEIVAEDPQEKGLRKILNFGHTLGHAIETHFLDKPGGRLLHGEAIAAGMVMEAFMAFKREMIDSETLSQVEEFMFTVYGRIVIPDSEIVAILEHTKQDKKNKGKEVRFSLINGRGSCAFDITCSIAEMKKAIHYYQG